MSTAITVPDLDLRTPAVLKIILSGSDSLLEALDVGAIRITAQGVCFIIPDGPAAEFTPASALLSVFDLFEDELHSLGIVIADVYPVG